MAQLPEIGDADEAVPKQGRGLLNVLISEQGLDEFGRLGTNGILRLSNTAQFGGQ